MKLSVIIPAYKEPFLQRTIDSLLAASQLGRQLEVIAVWDGPDYREDLRADPRLWVVELPENRGMRGAINAGLRAATGEFVAKVDAHCAFDRGFDKVLVESCATDWLMVPRRWSLDEATWSTAEHRPARDYHFLTFPEVCGEYGFGMSIAEWSRQRRRRSKIPVDDVMTIQGSFWLANRQYFMRRVGFLDDRPETYGPFACEQLEIGCKYWLGGGAIKVNKNTWYAHLSKRKHHYVEGLFSRAHKKDAQLFRSYAWAAWHWLNDEEPGMAHPFSWLVEKFDPPGWGGDWWSRLMEPYQVHEELADLHQS